MARKPGAVASRRVCPPGWANLHGANNVKRLAARLRQSFLIKSPQRIGDRRLYGAIAEVGPIQRILDNFAGARTTPCYEHLCAPPGVDARTKGRKRPGNRPQGSETRTLRPRITPAPRSDRAAQISNSFPKPDKEMAIRLSRGRSRRVAPLSPDVCAEREQNAVSGARRARPEIRPARPDLGLHYASAPRRSPPGVKPFLRARRWSGTRARPRRSVVTARRAIAHKLAA
ncbi:hypothetical protein EVAR_19082_1 [Eumeta japonica]|uniref:Uncharacterized protein n=1 Tax=Eumeta variegata TaxID=151549 RepID=A0A4C1UQW3_EUMVA|nr:hypothetical protein EVAR_19082_1 [Eumeta japonica]